MRGRLLLVGALALAALTAVVVLRSGAPATPGASALAPRSGAPVRPLHAAPSPRTAAPRPPARGPFRPALPALAAAVGAGRGTPAPADTFAEVQPIVDAEGPAGARFVLASKAPEGPLTPDERRRLDTERRIRRRAAGYAKPDQPDEFAAFHRALRTRIGAPAPTYPADYRVRALRALAEAPPVDPLGKLNGTVTWTERGPGNVSGRTRALVVDPGDATARTWFAGSVGGGIWKTTDAGTSWTDLTPTLPNLAVTALAQAASNPNVLYAGTGEGFYNTGAITGDGIWKSADRGATWALLPSTRRFNGFGAVNRLLVDPANPNVVLAATNTALYRSADGGGSWTKTFERPYTDSFGDPALARVQDVVAEPGGFGRLYLAFNGNGESPSGVATSTDGGSTWAVVFTPPGRRIELAVAPSHPGTAYAAVQNDGAGRRASDLHVTRDAGATWSPVTEDVPVDWLGGQGWYDNAIAVHPTRPGTVFVGGIDLYRIEADLATPAERASITGFAAPTWTQPLTFTGAARPGVAVGAEFHGFRGDVGIADFFDVEIRFGGECVPACSQKAHRFTAGASQAAYAYRDYVDVPFQVWDVTNGRQLMVSFRDRLDDGAFDLAPYNANAIPREYVYVHAIPYAPAPSPAVSVTGGQRLRNPYFVWVALAPGAAWTPNALPASKITIDATVTRAYARTTTKLTNWYPGLARAGGGVYPYLHADQHRIALAPLAGGVRLIAGNDGGVAYSDDEGVTWTQTLHGYNTAQFYGVDKRRGVDAYVGGMQDNGTWRSPAGAAASSAWAEQFGGDGFVGVWHAENPNLLFGAYQFNGLQRSTDGGATYADALAGLADTGPGDGTTAGPAGYFVVTVAKSASDPDLLLTTGNTGPYRSDDFGASWTKAALAEPATWFPGGRRAPAAVSPADPRVMWAGPVVFDVNATERYRVQVSDDGGHTFRPTAGIPGVAAFVSALAAHPTDPNTAYVAFSTDDAPKLYRTLDRGASWANLSGTFAPGAALSSNGFPNVAVYSVLALPSDPNTLWAGTEIGLVVSSDGGATWGRPAFSFPAVSVWGMSVVDDQVVVATHGRGVWTATLSDLAGYTPPVTPRAPRLDALAQRPAGNVGLRFTRRSAYDSLVVFRGAVRLRNVGGNAGAAPAEDLVLPANVTAPETVAYRLVAYVAGAPYRSATRTVALAPFAAPTLRFASNLDVPADANAFAASGFALGTPGGFTNGAFHTAPRPYGNGATHTLELRVPVVVGANGTTLTYDDVALVEPHTAAGAFYDYVVVEATRDGATWAPLSPRYDAREDAGWLARFNAAFDAAGNSTAAGDAGLLRPRAVEIGGDGGPFAPGDTLFVRFRMKTDGGVTGWGWAVDRVSIRENERLPVELVSFAAALDGAAVRLRWTTAGETNNAGWAVERASGEGAPWAEIGTVAGAGTTRETRAYRFDDAAVPFTADRVRYRLRQTDLDGAASYSAEVEAARGVPERFAVHAPAPNPVRDRARIRYELPAAGHVRVGVYSIDGRLVARLADEAQAAGRHEVTLDAAGLASGLYVLRVEAGAHVGTARVTVVR